MRIEQCPKKLRECTQQCPQYPCWAYEEQMERANRKVRDGWE